MSQVGRVREIVCA